ncbi:hypothetical protein A4A49_55850, partial [Nicotiana attenuata]
MIPVPTINKAYSMLMERESQHTMSNNLCANEAGVTSLMTMKGGPGQRPKRNFNLYCDYCKMNGHTREGCYKLIGYPINFKFKKKTRVNAAAHNVTIEDHKRQDIRAGSINEADKCSTDDVVRGPYFTPEHYNQIFKLLSNDSVGETSANMVGNIKAFLVNSNKKEWIIDSGATNHMISDMTMLDNKLEVENSSRRKVHLVNGGTT